VLLTLIGALRRRRPDWRLGLVAFEPGALIDVAHDAGCDVRVLPAPARLLTLGEHARSTRSTAFAALRAAVAVGRYRSLLAAEIARWQPDLVHANGLKAHVLSAMAVNGRPLVWHMHDYIGGRRVSTALLRRYAPRASRAVAVSRSVAGDLRTSLGPRVAVDTVYNGVDPRLFTDEADPLDLDGLAGLAPAPDGTTRVGLVATYAHWKGHRTFLDALAALPASLPVRAYVIGGPVYATRGSQLSRADILDLVRERHLESRVGLVPFQQAMAPVYRALDVVVHASTLPEPFGLVIVEAMFCGVAVIASASGGSGELVGDNATGLLHQAGNSRELAQAVERLVRDESLRARLAAAGRAHATARFDAGAMSCAFERLYEELCPRASEQGARGDDGRR
jgi:glycosyltransferase involved in cell wall biosynthesis